MTWECESCSREFIAEHSGPCPGCGSIDVLSLPEKIDPAATREAKGPTERHNTDVLHEILMRLCDRVYDLTFGSAEWQTAIDEAIHEILNDMKGGRT